MQKPMRIGSGLLVIWLLIGALAAWQRGYFDQPSDSCAKTGTTVLTVAVGPLNYVGVNPKTTCKLPQPSQ